MFNRCDFLLGKDGQSVLIVIPAHLPEAETYTVRISEKQIKFMADHQEITSFPYTGVDAFQRISCNVQVGIVECGEEEGVPEQITNMAYVEVWRDRV